MSQASFIAVDDDDESVRESLPDLLWTCGYNVAAFESAEAFLASPGKINASCLVLDVVMPGMSGPQLSEELKRRGLNIPIIFMTAHGGSARFEEGAAARLLKPFDPNLLIDVIRTALPSS